MNRRTFLAVAAAGVAGCSALGDRDDRTPTGESCSPAPDDNPGTVSWPTATGDRRNSRSVPRDGAPSTPLSVEWTVPLSEHTGAPTPTVADGTVYTTNLDTELLAVDGASGETLWQRPVSDPGVAALAEDAVLAAGDGALTALDRADGTERWTASLPHGVARLVTRPAVGAGLALVPTRIGLAAYDLASGERRWYDETGLAVGRNPAVVDGVVYATGGDAYVYALDAATGERVWRTKTPAPLEVGPVVVDATVYAGTSEGTLFALDADSGDQRWRSTLGAAVERLGADAGHVYAGTESRLVALRADDGGQCWRYGGFEASYAGGFAASPDRVYATASGDGTWGDTVVALDPETGAETWRLSAESRLTSGPAVVDGALYLGGVVAETGLATVKLA